LKYIIGIDSGATSSEVLLYPLAGDKATLKKYTPINFNVLGFDKSAGRLIHILKDSSKKIGVKNIVSVIAGISGARYENDRKKLGRVIKKATGIEKIIILPDAVLAFASVFDPTDKNCGILIAGTGSILYYRNSKGKLNRIGGWGRHIGDEGSGYWIAREALYKITKHYDGRERKTTLVSVLKKEFGIDSLNIIRKIYHHDFEISKLTKYVFECAKKGDVASKQILQNAAENLLTHFIPLGNKKYRIALLGSLFTEELLLKKYLTRLAKEKFRNISLITPKNKPVWGAVKIALNKKS
jgi:N-acetylglucosamine kinase